ncbi:MAG TPA: protein phosphatase 2C domain-containing protein, partial [Piscinibacter sp.]|nr:protein phosphatase 2C domain-containing protein [Piscinibacter sp.]
MSFEVEFGVASRNGAREANEDFAAALRSAPGDAVRGVIAAIADGVSSGGRGREAAQTSVLALLADFFATPPTWETSVALDRLMKAQNDWLVALNRQREGRADSTALTTLSALVLQGQGWTVAHVGDTRVWRIAGGEIQQLTQDHAYAQPDQRNRL